METLVKNFVKKRAGGDRWMTMVVLASTVFALLAAGCTKKESAASDQAAQEILVPVKAAVVKNGTVGEYVTFTGTIDATRRASIAPAVPGKINRILASEGKTVTQGEVLVQMDGTQLTQAKIKYESLKADYDRMKALRERGSVTPQQFEQIQSGYVAAQTAQDQMRDNTFLNAPFSGTVIGKYYSDGDMFNSMRVGPDGVGAILTIAQLGEMKIDINVPEADYVKLKTGQTALVRIGALKDTLFTGTVTMVTPALDMVSRTAKISMTIKNPLKVLKPGMFATVNIITNARENVQTVPAVAVVNIDGKDFLFEVPKGTAPYRCTATQKAVIVGLKNEETAEIVSGVEDGALVVTENNSALDEKTKITVTEIEQ